MVVVEESFQGICLWVYFTLKCKSLTKIVLSGKFSHLGTNAFLLHSRVKIFMLSNLKHLWLKILSSSLQPVIYPNAMNKEVKCI